MKIENIKWYNSNFNIFWVKHIQYTGSSNYTLSSIFPFYLTPYRIVEIGNNTLSQKPSDILPGYQINHIYVNKHFSTFYMYCSRHFFLIFIFLTFCCRQFVTVSLFATYYLGNTVYVVLVSQAFQEVSWLLWKVKKLFLTTWWWKCILNNVIEMRTREVTIDNMVQ